MFQLHALLHTLNRIYFVISLPGHVFWGLLFSPSLFNFSFSFCFGAASCYALKVVTAKKRFFLACLFFVLSPFVGAHF